MSCLQLPADHSVRSLVALVERRMRLVHAWTDRATRASLHLNQQITALLSYTITTHSNSQKLQIQALPLQRSQAPGPVPVGRIWTRYRPLKRRPTKPRLITARERIPVIRIGTEPAGSASRLRFFRSRASLTAACALRGLRRGNVLAMPPAWPAHITFRPLPRYSSPLAESH